MKFLTGFFSLEDAEQRSADIAKKNGCKGDISKFWFQVIKHKDDKEYALVIPDGEEMQLDKEEISALKDLDYMEKDNWFEETLNDGSI